MGGLGGIVTHSWNQVGPWATELSFATALWGPQLLRGLGGERVVKAAGQGWLSPPQGKEITPNPKGPHDGRTLLSHPRPLESSPALPVDWSLRWHLGSYLFFFLMYKTCKRRGSIKWPGKEALVNPAVPRDRGHAEADEWDISRCGQRSSPGRAHSQAWLTNTDCGSSHSLRASDSSGMKWGQGCGPSSWDFHGRLMALTSGHQPRPNFRILMLEEPRKAPNRKSWYKALRGGRQGVNHGDHLSRDSRDLCHHAHP
ncbi:hypothetical protein Cadr_000020377 [Camelus dromedarius]|uniref:Uncharacterized protein n=1 Tax=Camelus dromedarius TaxID=9838 RepID=A0A5N4D0Y3_CAMDR|nr:hypothetical protein Cadr_000020377 [Camelus dromedarius]